MFTSVASLSFNAQGVSWTADFEVKNASSANNTLRLLRPVVRKRGKKGMNPFNPIIPTTLSTRVYDPGKTLAGYIENNSNSDIAITIKKAGTPWHIGTLDRVTGGNDVDVSGPILDLVWDDSLPLLRDSDWTGEQGRIDLLKFYWYILQELPRSWNVRAVLETEHIDQDTSSGRTRSFRHDLLHQGKQKTYWDVLRQALQHWNMQIWQDGARWQIVHRSARGGTYSYEERDANGNESTGSFSPSVTASGSGWTGTITQKQIHPSSWAQTLRIDPVAWGNADFTQSNTEAITGTTVPAQWENDLTFDAANNQLTDTSFNGDICEQVLGPVLVRSSSEVDKFTLGANGEVVLIDSNDTNSIAIPVLQVVAKLADNTVQPYYLNNQGGWSQTPTTIDYNTNAIDSGTKTESWSFGFSDEDLPPDEKDWYIVVRAKAPSSGDPDGDLRDEFNEVRWDFIEIRDIKQNVTGDDDAVPGLRISLNFKDASRQQTDSFDIGTANQDINTPALDLRETATPHNGIRYLNTSGEWELLSDDGALEHASRSINGAAGDFRLLDRFAQHSIPIDRLTFTADRGEIEFRETISYDGRDFVPSFARTSIRGTDKEIEAIELRDDDTSALTTDVQKA